MSIGRYNFSKKIRNGKYFGTSNASHRINSAVKNGSIKVNTIILGEGQRLDHIAGIAYGDSKLWWVIASASGIGYGLQPQPGTLIKIPTSLNQVYSVI
jgi:hypothetical protein